MLCFHNIPLLSHCGVSDITSHHSQVFALGIITRMSFVEINHQVSLEQAGSASVKPLVLNAALANRIGIVLHEVLQGSGVHSELVPHATIKCLLPQHCQQAPGQHSFLYLQAAAAGECRSSCCSLAGRNPSPVSQRNTTQNMQPVCGSRSLQAACMFSKPGANRLLCGSSASC